MNGISFSMITCGNNDAGVNKIIDSIIALDIPEYEIIIVGGESTTIQLNDRIRHIPFDESAKAHIIVDNKPGRWITRKKNICIQESRYDICVNMHDYIIFDPNWWIEFQKFGTHWDLCVHQCICTNGARADGWRADNFPLLPRGCMIPYDVDVLSKYIPIQGNYFVVKRDVFLQYLFNEDLLWGQAEEMEWSRRIVPVSNVRCNPNCIVHYDRPKPDDERHLHVDMRQMEEYAHVFDMLRTGRMQNFVMYYE